MNSTVFSAADPGLPNINRRRIIATAPLLALAAAPALAAVAPETEVLRLFREWDAAQVGWIDIPEDDASTDAFAFHCEEVVTRLVAAPCADAGDLAAKIVAVCGWIDAASFDCIHAERLLADAVAMMRARGFRFRLGEVQS